MNKELERMIALYRNTFGQPVDCYGLPEFTNEELIEEIQICLMEGKTLQERYPIEYTIDILY